MKNKLVSTILLFGITVILVSSFHAFDSKFSAFAQTPDDSSSDPIPESNYTDTNTGPIPEDNSTDSSMGPIPEDSSTDPSMIPNPMDNSTDMQDLSPVDNNALPVDNMTMPENNMPVNIPAVSSNSASTLPPLEQVKSGVHAKDVQCKQGFTLIIKAEDGSPACVYSQVAQILIQRGW
ncbi:MAG: hypothetical protein KGI10_04185 [Thaumarchaeota archaeon]|nr:hypothetical protein [Nitrososphaerota archaeon]